MSEPIAGLYARETKYDTPPEFGNLIERNPMVRAIGIANRLMISQARSEAGPANSAVSPGSKRIPDPKTDPIYNAIICLRFSEAVFGSDVCVYG